MVTTAPPAAAVRRSPGKLYVALGILLVLLGPLLYFVQLYEKILRTPWYAPALAAVGVALLLLAIVRRFTVWRLIALVVFGLFAGLQWFFLLSVAKTPAYSGPAVTCSRATRASTGSRQAPPGVRT